MRIVPLTGPAEPLLDPDLVWDGRVGDLAVTPLTDPVNPGGLAARAALATAVLICLMTDIRVDPSELPPGEVNRGWPGDGFGLDDGQPLGSKLWLLRRRALTDGIELEAEDYAQEALQPLIDQGAFARFDVSATADRPRNRLDLDVAGYGRDGGRIYDQRFAVLWQQVEPLTAPSPDLQQQPAPIERITDTGAARVTQDGQPRTLAW